MQDLFGLMHHFRRERGLIVNAPLQHFKTISSETATILPEFMGKGKAGRHCRLLSRAGTSAAIQLS